MLIAPSGSLKTALLMALANLYPETVVCDSNWYYTKLLKMRPAFYHGGKRSIVVPELYSVYAGDPRTGSRVEQMFQQIAGEGTVTTQENDSRWERYEMRAQVFAALTPDFAMKKHKSWEEGFHRRFLWAHLQMENDEVLMDYLTTWRRAEIEVSQPMIEPAQKFIPDLATVEDRMRYAYFCRALSALKWHYRRMRSGKSAIETMKKFSVCLSKQAAMLVIPEEKTINQYRRQEEKEKIEAARLK
jgi:hypothetical protein